MSDSAICTILLCVFISACSVSGEQAATANKLCKDFGGVEKIDSTADYATRTKCKSGVKITGLTDTALSNTK